MIHFLQPYSFDLNIGKAYNEAIEPLDGWICITDQDTLKFQGFADRVSRIVDGADKTDVVTCVTNRLHPSNENLVPGLYDEPDINVHLEKYTDVWCEHGANLTPTNMPIAGVFMLFHKSVWDQVKFVENSIHFDSVFTRDVKNAGFKTYVAKGLYIFHLYRWGKNINDISHLQK